MTNKFQIQNSNNPKTLKFPEGFYWGAATSSHQVEGNNRNDWTEWELRNAKLKVQSAKLRNWPDYILQNYPNPLREENYISGKACDHYNRFREDFDIAKKLGHNAHRFSIEWSRIEPEEGKFDEKEIEHYRQVILALKERGIEPFVTLWHWTNPPWFVKKGGWLNKDAPKYFVRYVDICLRSLTNVKFWITLNEPAVYTSLSMIKGTQPPGDKSIFNAMKTKANFIKAHKLAHKAIHSISDSALVSMANSVSFFIPYKNKIYNRILAAIISYLENRFFRKIRRNIDYVAFQYYRSVSTGFKLGGSFLGIIENNLDSGGERSDLGWKIYPEGIYYFLKDLQKYNKPIYITENGIADAKDEKRTKFIKDHLYWVHKAISEGVDVRGYFYWSLLDNFEFVEIRGFWPRFGLVEVDYKTLERKIRSSALEYAKICKENKLDLEA